MVRGKVKNWWEPKVNLNTSRLILDEKDACLLKSFRNKIFTNPFENANMGMLQDTITRRGAVFNYVTFKYFELMQIVNPNVLFVRFELLDWHRAHYHQL